MNTGLTLGLIAGSVFVIAAVWIFVTRRSGKSTVVWMRPKGYRMAHAFRVDELSDELADVGVSALCGDRWPVAELVPLAEPIELGDDVPRCAACGRAVERMEHRHT